MRLPPSPLLLLAALLGLSQCKKSDSGPAKPEDQLPPATQTGAGTFGCLFNGQPWTPQGYSGKPNFIATYDAGYAGGSLMIRTYRYTNNSQSMQNIIITGAPVNKPGVYPISASGPCGVYYKSGISGPCNEYYNAPGLLMNGRLNVTRLDLKAGVISGTFDFKLWQPGCDTIKATQGRFDYTL